MYLSSITISGYKIFDESLTVNFVEGLTVIIGENGTGKSAIIDAIRLLLNEDEYGRFGVSLSDFHKSYQSNKISESINIKGVFSDLTKKEQVSFLVWTNNKGEALLNLQIENKENARWKYDKRFWVGEATSSMFEKELLDSISCVYLPPLRDAESKLEANRSSRISRLFKNINSNSNKEVEIHPLETKVKEFNEALLQENDIKQVKQIIKRKLKESLGDYLGQDITIQFSETTFDKIVEKLRILFYPHIDDNNNESNFRELYENSLGYNNLLYIATILAELEALDSEKTHHKILLIEEPEAHLHPQLQTRLLSYLQNESNQKNLQIIVTSHSPTITSIVSLESLNTLVQNRKGKIHSILLKDCDLSESTKLFLERWLDITKSVLFFAKGIIFVEGIAEALVLKEIAKIILNEKDLDEYGVSIININGINFKTFMEAFMEYKIVNNEKINKNFVPIKCSGLTDCDPKKDDLPTLENQCECKNPQSTTFKNELLKHSTNCRMFVGLKTFEYDLCMYGNNLVILSLVKMQNYQRKTDNYQRLEIISQTNWQEKEDEEKAKEAKFLLDLIKEEKGSFAHQLTLYLSRLSTKTEFTIPEHIEEAIKWVLPDSLS